MKRKAESELSQGDTSKIKVDFISRFRELLSSDESQKYLSKHELINDEANMFILAALEGNVEAMQLLLDKFPKLLEPNTQGRSVIHAIAGIGAVQALGCIAN